MQSHLATQSATQQVMPQPWSLGSLTAAPPGTDATPADGGRPRSSSQFMQPRTQASSSRSPPFMIQPGSVQAIGDRGAQQSTIHGPVDTLGSARDSESIASAAPQWSSPWVARANGQTPRQSIQHGSVPPDSQRRSRPEYLQLDCQALDDWIDHQQTSPQRHLAEMPTGRPQRLVQQPGFLDAGIVNPFARPRMSSPQAPASPTPFPPWNGSRGYQQQNGGGSEDNSNEMKNRFS